MKKRLLDFCLITILALLTSLSIGWYYNFLFFLILFLFLELLFYVLWYKLDLLHIQKKKEKIKKSEFWIFGSLIIISLFFGFLAYCPGNATYDSFKQWEQVQSNVYNNWHPVIHTLFSFKFPSLFWNNLAACTLFQMGIIFLILLYFCYFCRKNFLNFKGTLFVLLTIILNPLFLIYSVSLWKDIPFSWCIFLVTLFSIDIVLTNGNWLQKNRHKISFLLASFGVLAFRHNGLVPFVFLFFFLILFYPKFRKFSTVTFFSLLGLHVLITGPIYSALHIDSKTGGKAEMVGEIMGNISYYYNNGLAFTEEELETLNSIILLEDWQKQYCPKNFNYTKHESTDYNGKVNANFDKIIKIWFQKTLHHPLIFLKSFANMSSPIWETSFRFQGAEYSVRYVEGQPETSLLKRIRNFFQKNMVLYNSFVTYSPLRLLFINIGQGLLFILYAIALLFKKVKWDWKKYFPFLAILSNSFIMMALITGEEFRFVYYQSICVIPLLIYSFSFYTKEKEKSVKN